MTDSAAGHSHQSNGYHRPNSTVGPTRNVGVGGGNGDGFLEAANGIELTREDRQEGYDPDLIQLQPRHTPAQVDTTPSSAPIPASSLPYASRARDDPNDITSDRHRGGGERKKVSTERTNRIRDETSQYPSRPSKGSSRLDHSDGRHRGDQHYKKPSGGGGRGVRRSKRKELKWWKQPRTFIIALVLILVVGAALGVGLGVGLTSGNDERTPGNPGSEGTSPSSPGGGSGGGTPAPTGIEPSASASVTSSAVTGGVTVVPDSTGAAEGGIVPRPSEIVVARFKRRDQINVDGGSKESSEDRSIPTTEAKTWTRWD